MSGVVLRVQLFLISYTPLAFVFALRFLPDSLAGQSWLSATVLTPVMFAVITCVGVLAAVRMLRGGEAVSGVELEVTGVQDEGGNAAAYLATYLFPFLVVDEGSWQGWAAYGGYMVVLAVVTVRSNLVLINPTLYMLGRRIVRIEFTTQRGTAEPNEQEAVLICRRVPRPGDLVSVVAVADGYMEKST